MGLSLIIPCSFSLESLSQNRFHQPPCSFFQLRIKTPFRKNITDDSVFLFTEAKCKGNTQITHMDETEKHHRVIRLISMLPQTSDTVF